MLCLVMISSVSSQQRSNDSAIIPIKNLRNAILIKVDFDECQNKLVSAQDSIKIQDSIIRDQSQSIIVLSSKVNLFEANDSYYTQVVNYKDSVIGVRDQNIQHYKGSARTAWLITGLNTIVFLLLLI